MTSIEIGSQFTGFSLAVENLHEWDYAFWNEQEQQQQQQQQIVERKKTQIPLSNYTFNMYENR